MDLTLFELWAQEYPFSSHIVEWAFLLSFATVMSYVARFLYFRTLILLRRS